MTGVNFFAAELAAKRLELLRALVPTATRVAALLNPAEPTIAAANLRDVEAAAGAMGLQLRVLNASTIADIDAAFATFVNERPDALFISSGPFFGNRRVQLAHLATRYAVPAIHRRGFLSRSRRADELRSEPEGDHRQAGVYVGRILKGAKPADLPVVQSTKFELVINAPPAKALASTCLRRCPPGADEVIERAALRESWRRDRVRRHDGERPADQSRIEAIVAAGMPWARRNSDQFVLGVDNVAPTGRSASGAWMGCYVNRRPWVKADEKQETCGWPRPRHQLGPAAASSTTEQLPRQTTTSRRSFDTSIPEKSLLRPPHPYPADTGCLQLCGDGAKRAVVRAHSRSLPRRPTGSSNRDPGSGHGPGPGHLNAPFPTSTEAPRVHHAARRRGGGVAACGTRAAT